MSAPIAWLCLYFGLQLIQTQRRYRAVIDDGDGFQSGLLGWGHDHFSLRVRITLHAQGKGVGIGRSTSIDRATYSGVVILAKPVLA